MIGLIARAASSAARASASPTRGTSADPPSGRPRGRRPHSSSRQRQDLVSAHPDSPPSLEVGDEPFASPRRPSDFLDLGRVSGDFETDLRVRVQPELLPDPLRDRDLPLGCDSHGAPVIFLLILLLHMMPSASRGERETVRSAINLPPEKRGQYEPCRCLPWAAKPHGPLKEASGVRTRLVRNVISV